MNELDWFKCETPYKLAPVLAEFRDPRKERFVAVACVRRISYLLPQSVAHAAIGTAERFADGLATERQLGPAAVLLEERLHGDDSARQALRLLVQPNLSLSSLLTHAAYAPSAAPGRAVLQFLHLFNDPVAPQTPSPVEAEEREQCRLVREVFGNPWQRVTVQPEWLRWENGVVLKMARAIYSGSRWEELPILADALEDAGCEAFDILEHLRNPSRHVRGCWALDAILQFPAQPAARCGCGSGTVAAPVIAR